MSEQIPDQSQRLPARIWRSIFRRPIVPREDRERRWAVLNFLVLHLRPVRVPEKTIRFSHTWGLGGMSLVLVTLLIATGGLLMLTYEPSPDHAYEAVTSLQYDGLFGQLVRNIHHWGANILIAVALLHLLRVFLTGAFRGPRQFNWVMGLALLALVLAANFTGYLLPWDQLSYWAVTICTGMLGYVPGIGQWLQGMARGGAEVGPATLVIFYTFHTTVVPVCLVLLMAFHFWRVRKAGGVVMPRAIGEKPEKDPARVLFLPNLLTREVAVALTLIAAVMVLAALVDAPLSPAANPGMSPNPAKAPWYFMGFQELQLHFHPFFAVVLIPLLAAAALVLLPYLRSGDEGSGVMMISATGRRAALTAAVTGALATPILVIADELWLHPAAWLPSLSPVISNGLLPVSVLAAAGAFFVIALKRRLSATREETLQTVVVLLFVALAVLTVIGVWFRGPGMALVWPWAGG